MRTFNRFASSTSKVLKMKIFISADMEGATGIVSNDQRDPNGKDYEKGRKLMASDVNAAIEGALEAGATEIVVNDSHWNMRNIIPLDINPKAFLISGEFKPLSMMQGIDKSFDAVFFIGYHAQRGTPQAIFDHTYTESSILQVRINGCICGETGLNAALAGYFNVPVILISGDDKVCKEASDLLGKVTIAPVKFSESRLSARCLSPEQTKQIIKEKAKEALRDLTESKFKPFTFTPPITMEVDFVFTHQADKAMRIPKMKRLGATTVAYTSDDYLEVFKIFLAIL